MSVDARARTDARGGTDGRRERRERRVFEWRNSRARGVRAGDQRVRAGRADDLEASSVRRDVATWQVDGFDPPALGPA